MADMKFKYTIQPYQTEAVDSVVGVFAGQAYNDRFTYRRDVETKRDSSYLDLYREMMDQESQKQGTAQTQKTAQELFFENAGNVTKGTLNLKPIEQAKINCAKKLFNKLSTADVVYHDVKTYQDLINIMESL